MTRGERHGASLRACSACSGDYEDPERTASSDFVDRDAGDQDDADENDADEGDGDQQDGVQRSAVRDEFPVPEG
jgi:hypothetical protein